MDQLGDLQRLLQGGLMRQGAQGDIPLNDTSEQIQISSLALLKMLKHGRILSVLISARKGWCANGSHGTYAWRVYRQLHCSLC